MMGAPGLRRATTIAILNANYIARRLHAHYPVVYSGADGLVAHECIIDLAGFKGTSGITTEDCRQTSGRLRLSRPDLCPGRLADSFMIEPTESEPLEELDRFCDALIAIRAEIQRLEEGEWDADDNPPPQRSSHRRRSS